MRVFAFIDASNLFYGGHKNLGWRIDYQKLFNYLKEKYKAERAFYFGGVETYNFNYNYLKNDSLPIEKLEKYLVNLIKEKGHQFDEAKLLLVSRHLKRISFYLKLKEFGYKLYLKPVKSYEQNVRTAKEIRQFAGNNFRDFVRLEKRIKFEE